MIPVVERTGKYTVTWGDASIDTDVSGYRIHTYKNAGTYTVSIYGDFSRIYLLYYPENMPKLQSIEQWGDIRWESMRGAFSGASNMVYRATDAPDLSGVTDTSEMFRFATSFNGNLSTWDVSHVTDMRQMFDIATAFNGDISSWNVSGVTDMSNMFLAARIFTQNLGDWHIVLDETTISDANKMLAISAQNSYLDGQNLIYTIDQTTPGGDKFRIVNGSHLAARADQTVAPGQYNVTIKSTGSFGVGNSKIVEITVSDDILLQINSLPSIEAGSAQTVLEGSEVSLNGTATDPEGDAMTYLWAHNSTDLNIVFANATSASTTFTAPQVEADTAIAFTLTAHDGTDTSSDSVSITVTAYVNGLPLVKAGPAQTVLEGSEVSLNGTATDPEGDAMTYLWAHNSTDLNIVFANATSASTTFIAPPVDSDTDIIFTLTADDGAEAHSDTVTVTVTDVQANNTQTSSVVLEPQEPRGTRDIGLIILNSTLPGVIDVAWDAPSEAPADYRLSWAKADAQFLTWTDLSGNAFPTDTSYKITGLEEDEAYKVIVRARYDGTSGDWSGEITITAAWTATAPVTPDNSTVPEMPRGLAVSRSGNGALTVSWQAPSSDGGLALTGYVVQWKEAGGSWDVPADVSEETTTATTHTVTGLTNGVSYTVRVLATNQAGSGSHSDEETGTPLAPREIAGLTLSSTTPGTIRAVWDAPSEAPADYRLSWAKVDTQFLTWTDLSGNAFPTDASYTITDLEEGEAYKVIVRARYSGTSGDWSGESIITVTGTG